MVLLLVVLSLGSVRLTEGRVEEEPFTHGVLVSLEQVVGPVFGVCGLASVAVICCGKGVRGESFVCCDCVWGCGGSS